MAVKICKNEKSEYMLVYMAVTNMRIYGEVLTIAKQHLQQREIEREIEE